MRNTLSLLASTLLAFWFHHSFRVREILLLCYTKHTLGQKAIKGNPFLSYRETYVGFMDPTLALKLFLNPVHPLLNPFIPLFLFFAAFTMKELHLESGQ